MKGKGMRVRAGFTIMELLVVLILAGIVGAMTVPTIGRSMARTNLQRAANVLSLDMQSAFATAARQRVPVRLTVDQANKVMRVSNNVNGGTIHVERWYDTTAPYPVDQMLATSNMVVVFPNGMAGDSLLVTLRAGGTTRMVRMTRAGQIRIQ